MNLDEEEGLRGEMRRFENEKGGPIPNPSPHKSEKVGEVE
jgi:hypothetical protein